MKQGRNNIKNRLLAIQCILLVFALGLSGCTGKKESISVRSQPVDPMNDVCVESFMDSTGMTWKSRNLKSTVAQWAIVLTPEKEEPDNTLQVVVSKYLIANIPDDQEKRFLFAADLLTNSGTNGYDYELKQLKPKKDVAEAVFLVRQVIPTEDYDAREEYQRVLVFKDDAIYIFFGKGEDYSNPENEEISADSLLCDWAELLGGKDPEKNLIQQDDTYWLYSDERVIEDKSKSLKVYQTKENGLYKWVYTYPLASGSDDMTFTILKDGMDDYAFYSMQISTSSDAQYSFQTIDSMFDPDIALEDINGDGWKDLLISADDQVWLWDANQQLFVIENNPNILKASVSQIEGIE